jgi:hypothetical protein
MDTNLIVARTVAAPADKVREDLATPSKVASRATKWLLVSAQVFVLLAYAMGMGFLVKTTAGTLVLFSLVAPVLVAIAALTLIAVSVRELRGRHGMAGFQIYGPGQIIFRQGEPGDCAYFIQSGEVEMFRHENGAEKVIARLSEGEYFGEKALISTAPRILTTRAVTPTRVEIIRKRSFFTMVIVLPARVEDTIRGDRPGKRSRKLAS